MKLGIMQPYIFPYIGYFQLIHAVNTFIIYDDVAFIKQGWINRNNILLNGIKYQFTVPLQNTSSNNLISQTIVSDKPFKWEQKLLQTITNAYRKAPFFRQVFPLIEFVIKESSGKSIGCIASKSIEAINKYLDTNTTLIRSSQLLKNAHLKSEARIIDICKKENADTYINAIGGRALYNAKHFSEQGIQLYFLKTADLTYRQFNNQFIPSLSIIDVMMFNDVESIHKMLSQYELI